MHVWALVVGLAVATSAAQPAAAIDISGVVRDSSGAPVRAAEVGLLTPALSGIARTRTDAEGKFSLPAPAPGTYLLVVRAEAFGESHHAVTVGAEAPTPLEIVIHPAGLREEVTVTASRGSALNKSSSVASSPAAKMKSGPCAILAIPATPLVTPPIYVPFAP